MSTRASNARHVRQRKLNTKQPLRIIREQEIEEALDDESQRHIPQVETGVEKGEEIEYHLQAVINAANAATLGAKTKPNYIPTPEVTQAKDVKYDDLYPKVFSQPATYIRFSSTVEDCIGVTYCMNEDDAKFLTNLNKGKDANGQPFSSKSGQCSEDTFEEVMNFFEETSQRIQPFANVDSAPLLSLEEMDQHREETFSADAIAFLKPIYQYWELMKGNRPLMPTIKVRVLDTTSEADDADPYVCFRRREVRQTRKTRGRDAQVVEKLKKLRLELEQARSLVLLVKQREEFNKQNLEISRDVFEKRRQLKEVKITKNIVGEKGEDEELLINQKPVPKPKARQDTGQQRPATIRLRSLGDRSAPDNDLISLAELRAEAETHVLNTIESRKEQHKRWNHHWQDKTWDPITPPPDDENLPPKWAPLFSAGTAYPTPPPSLPSRSSQEADGDVEMTDRPAEDATEGAAAEPEFNFFFPPTYPTDVAVEEADSLFALAEVPKRGRLRSANPACRIRYGRGGRRHLEQRSKRPRVVISGGVVSDGDSDDEADVYYPASENKTFEYRVAFNNRLRPDTASGERRHWQSGDQAAMIAAAQAAAAASGQGGVAGSG